MSTELLKSIEETERQLENLKKQLEESHNGNELWIPAYGQEYFSVKSRGTVARDKWTGDIFDEGTYANHNVFLSEALAREAVKLMRRSNLVISACLQVKPDFKPDWRNPGQTKWFPRYDHDRQKWEPDYASLCQYAGACVSSKEALQKVLKILNAQAGCRQTSGD